MMKQCIKSMKIKVDFYFIYNIPHILLSSIISGFINGIIEILALTDSLLISLKE